VTEEVIYDGFRVEVEETPGGEITTYTPEQICEWIEDIETIEATHGTITISKEPTYVFTKWHKLNDGTTPAGMELMISFNADTGGFGYIIAKMIVQRYATDDNGENLYDEYEIYEGPVDSSGTIERIGEDNIKFEHAGTEESKLFIEFITEEGNYGTVEAPIPINGYSGINISEPVSVEGMFKKSIADEESFEF